VPRPLPLLRRALAPAVLGAVLAAGVLTVAGSGAAEAASPGARPAASRTLAPARATLARTGSDAPARGMWVWTQPSAKTLVSFARTRGVTDLFVSVPPRLPSSSRLAWVRSVASLAGPAGIRLQALGGDPGWVDDPDAAVAWERAALSTGLFAGAHVDVEPWARADWDTDRTRVVAGYLAVLDRLQAATTLPLEADVPFWLWTLDAADGRPLDAAVLRRVDRATVMSYRNTVTGPDSITDVAARTVATAGALGTPVRLAVETQRLGSDPVSLKQTFFGSTEAKVNAALGAVDAAEAGVPTYAGTAVHDYAGYTALP
jgi:hypothetical protein